MRLFTKDRVILSAVGLALLLGAALGVPLGLRLSGAVRPFAGDEPGPVREERLTGDEEAVVRAVERVGPSVVKISVTQRGYIDGLFGRVPSEQTGLGSGVIIDRSGLVLTNHHVVEGAEEIVVGLPDGRVFEGRLVGTYPAADLAVLRIDGDDLPVAELAPGEPLRVGQLVIAIGNPFGLDYSATTGIISALGRELAVDAGLVLTNLIQTDAAINPGNSGGPLLNLRGEVIGINTAVNAQAQGIGFAIPINTALEVMDQLITQGRVVREGGPFLGVEFTSVDERIARMLNLPEPKGAMIIGVVSGSAAHRAGLRVYDVIERFGETEIDSPDTLVEAVSKTKPGDEVLMVVIRQGRRIAVPVVIGQREQN